MMIVQQANKYETLKAAKLFHYLKRRPNCSYAFELTDKLIFGKLLGICTFGVPASRHLQISVCKSNPDLVLELNRLWVSEEMPRNSESFFVSRCLKQLPARIIVSYADTKYGHVGYIYRALNFKYAGITDSDRKTPRFDYVTPNKHSRDTSRNGTINICEKVRRLPKHRYWTVTGNKREKKHLESICLWDQINWK